MSSGRKLRFERIISSVRLNNDELDKTGQQEKSGPTGALYPLLERQTAERFTVSDLLTTPLRETAI